jgi:DNA-binding response OmpR family regulator
MTKLTATLTSADVAVDLLTARVTRADRPVRLTMVPYRLLVALMSHADQTLTKQWLHENILDRPYQGETNPIAVHIARLREALGEPLGAPVLIVTGGRPGKLTETYRWSAPVSLHAP